MVLVYKGRKIVRRGEMKDLEVGEVFRTVDCPGGEGRSPLFICTRKAVRTEKGWKAGAAFWDPRYVEYPDLMPQEVRDAFKTGWDRETKKEN